MFFGAGNLIFPPIMGAAAGTHFTPAMVGMLIGSVALPVITVIAVAFSGTDVRDLSSRGGAYFGTAFSVLIYLSIGAFYALPRTGAVSFSVAVTPITGWDSPLASTLFNACFFGVGLYLAWNPRQIVARLGKILTPLLLLLLAILVFLSLTRLPHTVSAPTGGYVDAPLATGLNTGYMTMDALAALAFGIIVVSSLKNIGGGTGAKVIKNTSLAAVIAGGLLGLVYIGLGLIGRIMPRGQSYTDGATLLADAAGLTMGTVGQVIFGLTVLTACLTTAVGLLAATSEFFTRLLPRVSYKGWLILFALLSFTLASLGLQAVVQIAAPIITFLYAIAITIVFVTLVTYPLRFISPFIWAFRLSAWTVTAISALTTLAHANIATAFIYRILSWIPGYSIDLGWVLPTFCAFLIGVGADMTLRKK